MPKKPKLTYELITNLFDFLETRGVDASGVWASECFPKNRIIYHKAPVRSSAFIKDPFWKQNISKMKMDLMLIHARATSKGNGHARDNHNNHPFVSADNRIGMVHNGTIAEANYLKKKYKILSNTDSEVLLRMYEHAAEGNDLDLPDIPEDIVSRMKGIRDIWSVISQGAMAVAIGERIDEHKKLLCLFHNEHRPLWMADLRESLGQLFFFSSPEIWYSAMEASSKTLNNICAKDLKLHELPVSEAWFFTIDKENPSFESLNQMHRFHVNVKDTGRPWNHDVVLEIKEPEANLELITQIVTQPHKISQKETLVISPKKIPASNNRWKEDWDNGQKDRFEEPFAYQYDGGTEHESICADIQRKMDNISVSITNACLESSIRPNDYQEIIEHLEQIRLDAEGLLNIVEN